MKAILLFTTILCTACTNHLPSSEVVESERVFAPQKISTEDMSSIQAICSAVRQKSDRLYTLSTGIIYSFDYSLKNCRDPRIGEARVISAQITLDRSNYVFSSADQPFPFPIIETPQTGIMGDLCERPDLKNPTLAQNGTAVWFYAMNDSRLCQSDHEHRCLMVERGTLIKERSYRIMSREILKFRMSGPRTGFVVARQLSFKGDCDQGTMERRLVLK